MKIIDTHAHLDHLEDIQAVLDRAQQAGVEGVVTMSVNAQSCLKNLEIKKNAQRPNIFLAFGMHPSDADIGQLEACVNLVKQHRGELTAVGEIGLDFWYKWVRKDNEKKDEQRAVYRRLLEAADEMNLPAVIHTRGAWRESFETAKAIGITRAEFHWYSGPVDVLKDILDAGYFISASPSLAHSPQSREAVAYAPIDRIMIETDSPVFYRPAAENADGKTTEGFQAEPKDVFRTLSAYCELMNTDREKALAVFNRNAREFFRLDK